MKCYFLLLMLIAIPLFSGTNSEFTYSGNLYDDQNFYSFKSPLNPGNVLNVRDGFSGNLKYDLEMKYKKDDFAFQFGDVGFLEAETNATLTNKVTEIYLSYNLLGNFIDIGKKKITQSVCFLRSPIDFILDNSKDVSRNNTYNLQFSEGRFMANADLYTDFGVWGFSYIPRVDFTNDAVRYFSRPQIEQEEFRYFINVLGADMALAVSHDEIWRAGANFSKTIGDSLEFHAEGVYLENKERPGLATNRIVTGFNPAQMSLVYTDMLSNTTVKISNTCEVVIGGTYNADAFSLILEYFYNGSGYSSDEWNVIRDIAKESRRKYDADSSIFNKADLGALQTLASSGILTLCRHYAMVRLSNPSSEKIGLTSTTLLNLQDWSGTQIFSAGYSGWDHAGLTLNISASFGDEYSEFKMMGQDWALSLELNLNI